MLGKQRKDQANDPQFMNTAWKNMAEILDQELPVEKKERRIGWLSIAAILIMGFVGGITAMWGLQKHQSTPIAANHSTDLPRQTNLETGTIFTNSKKEENPTLKYKSSTKYNSKTTHDQIKINSTDHKVRSQNTVNTENEWVAPNHAIQPIAHFNQDELSQNPDPQKTSHLLAIAENLTETATSSVKAISINSTKIVAHVSTPLSELPTLEMTTLPVSPTDFTMNNDLDFPKDKKWKTGVYAGAIIAGKTGNGLEAALRVERKLGAKWALETGLGLRATQLAFLSKNEGSAENSIEDNFQATNDPDIELSDAERNQIIANNINANAPDYHLAVPLSLVFRPMGKLHLALGMSWAYRLNKLEDASSLRIPSNGPFQEITSSSKNSFSDRFNDFRLNLGVGYQFNTRTGIELAYSKRLSNRNNSFGDTSSVYSISDEGSSPASFFQLGLIYYFGG